MWSFSYFDVNIASSFTSTFIGAIISPCYSIDESFSGSQRNPLSAATTAATTTTTTTTTANGIDT